MSDQDDLQQYTFFNSLINSHFDSHPEIQRILQASGSEPGAFAKAIQVLPNNVLSDLRSNHSSRWLVRLYPTDCCRHCAKVHGDLEVNDGTNIRLARGLWRYSTAVLLVLSATACGKSEPTYSGISIMGQNYLPYNLSRFTITDAYGNKAGGGGDNRPGGGGSVTCCYKLKGTEFTVKWDYYDADQWTMEDSHRQHAETKVVMPPSTAPENIGSRIFEVHFYPDRHVEFQFPGGLLDDSRIPVVDVSRWMSIHYRQQLDKKFDDNWAELHRRISRVIAAAWLKYRLTDQTDLGQFVYFNLLVNDQFDAHPEVQRILRASAREPGAFAKAIQALPKSVMSELRGNHFKPVAVPAIPDGLVPPPRESVRRSGSE